MTKCSNQECHRTADYEATYSFDVGPRVTSPLCGPCRDMLIEGDHAVDIEVEEI